MACCQPVNLLNILYNRNLRGRNCFNIFFSIDECVLNKLCSLLMNGLFCWFVGRFVFFSFSFCGFSTKLDF